MNDKIWFFDIILQIILIILSYLIPKNNNLLIFWSWNWKSFKWNTKYLYLYWLKNTDYSIYFLTKNKEIISILKNKKVLNIYSIKAFFTILRAKYIFIEQSTKDISYMWFLVWNFSIVQTWHWIPLKNIELPDSKNIFRNIFNFLLKKEFRSYNFLIWTSNFTNNIFKKVFNNQNIFITWYPRNDIFFNKNLLLDDIYNKLNLSWYKKIITYAPTFRDTWDLKPFSQDFLDKLNTFCIENNYLFLLKLHPFDKSKNLSINNFKNIINLDKTTDLQELLVNTDILITDYSSVFFDFMITKKPIIYYSFDYNFYIKNCRDMYFDYYKDIPGPFIKSEDELLELLENINIWFNDKDYKNKYLSFIDKIHKYQDWNSSKRVFNLIINNK